MLKEQDIREYLKKKDITFNENSSIIGVYFRVNSHMLLDRLLLLFQCSITQ